MFFVFVQINYVLLLFVIYPKQQNSKSVNLGVLTAVQNLKQEGNERHQNLTSYYIKLFFH